MHCNICGHGIVIAQSVKDDTILEQSLIKMTLLAQSDKDDTPPEQSLTKMTHY